MRKNIDAHGTNNDLEATLARNLYYKEQVTNVPAEYYYHVGDVSFDGYRDGILVDAKGEGLLKFIETNWTASVYGNGGLADWALRRLEAVHNAGATTPPPSTGTSRNTPHSSTSATCRQTASSHRESALSTVLLITATTPLIVQHQVTYSHQS